MIRIATALACALALSGCAGMTLQEVEGFIDRVNARIATVDEVAHRFCPSLATIGVSAKTVACVAKANGTTQRAVNAAIAWGQTFCANPTSTGVGSLTVNATAGVRAVLAADASGCTAPQ